jgi:hypothetical protein
VASPPPTASHDQRVADLRLPIRELASGVDALYLSGHGTLVEGVWDTLSEARNRATAEGEPIPYRLAGTEFALQPHGWGRYGVQLDHEAGVVGFTASEHLPAARFQPRAEFIHSIGALGVVEWAQATLAPHVDGLRLSVSRIDLFADWQGWAPSAEDRANVVFRARKLDTHEDNGQLTGFGFGRRHSGMSGRMYDKVAELRHSGAWYWTEVWGEAFDPTLPVWRTEFEFGRKILSEFRVDDPQSVLSAVSDLWRYATQKWLTLRSPTRDETRSRWPVDPVWLAVQSAALGAHPVGRDRMRKAQYLASLEWLTPRLVSHLATLGALVGSTDLEMIFAEAAELVASYEQDHEMCFADRIAEKQWRACWS